jgi:putative NADH-flavin reductase
MERKEVRRFVSLSSMGVGDSRSNLGFVTKFIIVPIFLRHAFADHAKQESVIRLSSLDWIIVRPPRLKDSPRTGQYKHGIPIGNKEIQGIISRADVADFMLNQLTEGTYLRQEVGISY